mgnify:CR=1 FL=1
MSHFSLYFFHPHQIPTRELHHNLVHLRALAQRLHSWRTSIAVYLLHSLLPLLRSLCLEIFLRQIFQFHYVAVLGLIVCQVGQQEEITVAVAQFQLRGGDVIIVQAQISHKEALDAALALDGVTHRGQVFISISDVLQRFPPLTVEGHPGEQSQ